MILNALLELHADITLALPKLNFFGLVDSLNLIKDKINKWIKDKSNKNLHIAWKIYQKNSSYIIT